MNVGELNPHLRLLLGPGPSPVHPRVLKAMSTNVVGHLDPDFLSVMDDCQVMLRGLFGTENRVTFPVSGTGSAGMEAAVCNVIEPGDKAIICVNGVFGGRMADVAGRYGAEVIKVEAPWGQPIDPADVKRRSTPIPAPLSSELSTPRRARVFYSRWRRSGPHARATGRFC